MVVRGVAVGGIHGSGLCPLRPVPDIVYAVIGCHTGSLTHNNFNTIIRVYQLITIIPPHIFLVVRTYFSIHQTEDTAGR